jgi:hypothetical protein
MELGAPAHSASSSAKFNTLHLGAQSHLPGESACLTKTQPLRPNVGQTLSSVNPAISAIVPRIG